MTTTARIARRRAAAPDAPVGARRSAHRLVLLVLPLLGLLAWQVVCWVADPRPWLLPSPSDVAGSLVDDRARLWHHALGTMGGALAGLAIAAVAGVALAVAIRASRAVERTVYPWAIASQAIPILAVAPILAIWVGYGPSRMLVAAILCFFPIVVAGVDGLRAVDPEVARTLRTLGASPGWVWRHATLPAALPSLFSGLKMAAVFSVTAAVVAEYIGSDRGLGHLSQIAIAQFQTDLLFAAVAWLAALGLLLFGAVALAERIALPHRRHPTRPRWRSR